jgi:hypothetical protein
MRIGIGVRSRNWRWSGLRRWGFRVMEVFATIVSVIPMLARRALTIVIPGLALAAPRIKTETGVTGLASANALLARGIPKFIGPAVMGAIGGLAALAIPERAWLTALLIPLAAAIMVVVMLTGSARAVVILPLTLFSKPIISISGRAADGVFFATVFVRVPAGAPRAIGVSVLYAVA